MERQPKGLWIKYAVPKGILFLCNTVQQNWKPRHFSLPTDL